MATLPNQHQHKKTQSTGQLKYEDLPEQLRKGLKAPLNPEDFNKKTIRSKSYEEYLAELRNNLKQELVNNPRAGPRPIDINEYRKRQRNPNFLKELGQEPIKADNNIKKRRGGVTARIRRQLGELHRIVNNTTDQHQKHLFLKKIKELQCKQLQHKNRNNVK